jgi:Histidine kinase-, DNA gyrase B-, and HSP90-like ATPase
MRTDSDDYHIEDYVHDVDDLVATIRGLSWIKGHERDAGFLANQLEAINGLASVLSSKTAFMSFVNLEGTLHLTEISVYRSVTRAISAVKHIERLSLKKGLTFQMVGESHGSLRGPNVFEFIPFMLLENAIKYSPRMGRVLAEVLEDSANFNIRIFSSGPMWERDEETRLFEKGFRGKHAQNAVSKGAGVGLYFVKKALSELYDATISAEQKVGPDLSLNGIVYRDTTFSIRIPK